MANELPPLKIDPAALKVICAEGARAYPQECCGILLGVDTPAAREIRQAIPAANIAPDHRHDRFTIDPRNILDAQRTAAAGGLEIVGFFHSHPDHPARPSPTDRAAAWEFYSYVIVSICNGSAGDMASFRLFDGIFVPEPMDSNPA